jgi:SPP1 family predicted phage head-tail adaptor
MPVPPYMIDPATLRHVIQIGGRSSTQDTSGQLLNTWPIYLATRASIEQLSGQQLYQGDEFTSAKQVRIIIRWPGRSLPAPAANGVVNVGDRVFYLNHIYEIQIADNVQERNRKLVLNCVEIDGSA